MELLEFVESNKKDKKYKIVFNINNRKKTFHFGNKNSITYVEGGDEKKRQNYLKRHSVREDWNNINNGSLSAGILWGDTNDLTTNLNEYLKEFNIEDKRNETKNLTYKQKLNSKFGFDKNKTLTNIELEKLTGIPINILEEVKKRGIGAYETQLSSVRLKNNFVKDGDLRKGKNKRLSPEQWGEARKIAFVYKSLYEDMKIKPQDLDLYKKIFT